MAAVGGEKRRLSGSHRSGRTGELPANTRKGSAGGRGGTLDLDGGVFAHKRARTSP